MSVVYNIFRARQDLDIKYACHYCCAHAECGDNYCSYHNSYAV